MKIFNLLAKIGAPHSSCADIRDIILHKGFSILLRLLAPISPHLTHQLWQDLHYEGAILEAAWPKGSPIIFKIEMIELVVQVNGKLRGHIRVPPHADQTTIEDTIKQNEKIQQAIQSKSIKKIIVVPQKLVNIVTGE